MASRDRAEGNLKPREIIRLSQGHVSDRIGDGNPYLPTLKYLPVLPVYLFKSKALGPVLNTVDHGILTQGNFNIIALFYLCI